MCSPGCQDSKTLRAFIAEKHRRAEDFERFEEFAVDSVKAKALRGQDSFSSRSWTRSFRMGAARLWNFGSSRKSRQSRSRVAPEFHHIGVVPPSHGWVWMTNHWYLCNCTYTLMYDIYRCMCMSMRGNTCCIKTDIPGWCDFCPFGLTATSLSSKHVGEHSSLNVVWGEHFDMSNNNSCS